MTEDERVDIVQLLGLQDDDVMVIEADDNTPAKFHLVVVEGGRIMLVSTGWGELVISSWRQTEDGTPACMGGMTVLDVGGQLTMIPFT